MGFIKNYNELAKTPERKIILDLLETGISAIQPEKILNKFSVSNINNYENIYLIGFGKGSARISKIIEQKLGDKLKEGYVIDVTGEEFKRIQMTIGTHPLPSQINLDFTKKIVDRFGGKVSEKDLIIVVVTGGGSALFELPIEGVTLEQLIEKNNELLKSGLTITQMNEERKKISKVKGGKLAGLLKPAKVLGLIFSDVPGNDLSIVASGPTVDGFTENILMLSNETALDAIKDKALSMGYNVQTSNGIEGEAKVLGKSLIENSPSHTVIAAGGETTVKVNNPNGKGGRNQELVLGVVESLGNQITIASFDSDGWDNTEFGGAIGDFKTLEKAKELNLNMQEYLSQNNSFEFFQKTGDGILTGRLPTNIADLIIILKK